MMHGARVPDPPKGQSLVCGLSGYKFLENHKMHNTMFRCFTISVFFRQHVHVFFNKNGLETIWQKIPSVTSHLSKSSALVKVTFNLGPFYCIFLIDFIILSWVASLPSGSLQVHSFSFTSSTMGAMATACASYMSNTGWVAQILIEA